MKKLLLPIAALLISDALLLVGHGIQITLLPLRAELEGFSAAEIAFTGTAYFVGFVAGCLITPHILRRAGHIRSFAVLCSVFSAVVLLFHALPIFQIWLGLRFLVGCCISGLYMIIESWLNDRAPKDRRATVLSIYVVINLTMMVVGQQALNLAPPSTALLFALASILLSLAIVPVSITLALQPAPVQPVRLNFRRVWQISRVGLMGAGISGMVTGAFWSLGPVFARGVGLETARLTLFMSAVVLGGALMQFPLGRLSDRYDRRLIVFFCAIAGAALSLLIALLTSHPGALLPLALFWGGAVMTQYALCLAHAADGANADEFVMVGSCILLTFGSASAIGAPLASLFMKVIGPPGVFYYAALCLGLQAAMIAVRRKQNVRPVIDETGPFRSVADTSPAMFEMDPRTTATETRPAAEQEIESRQANSI